MKKIFCRWYNKTSAIKRAYDLGLIDKKWVENYCWNAGKNCYRKQRFEKNKYISPDYILPDGTEDLKLKKYYSDIY